MDFTKPPKRSPGRPTAAKEAAYQAALAAYNARQKVDTEVINPTPKATKRPPRQPRKAANAANKLADIKPDTEVSGGLTPPENKRAPPESSGTPSSNFLGNPDTEVAGVILGSADPATTKPNPGLDNQRSRGWCITDFRNNSEKSWSNLTDKAGIGAQYATYQVEQCPTTKKIHKQGYVYFANARSGKYVRGLFPECHIEKQLGNNDQAIDYCHKDYTKIGAREEWGKRPTQGKRVDIENACKTVREKGIIGLLKDETNDVTYVKYHRGLEKLEQMTFKRKTSRNWKSFTTFIFGKTRVGKTHWCHEDAKKHFPNDEIFVKTEHTGKWWDGYHGQPVVIIDEGRYETLKIDQWKVLLDRYALTVETKGGTEPFLAKRIYITSNTTGINEWMGQISGDINEDKRAVMERFDQILEMTSRTTMTEYKLDPNNRHQPKWLIKRNLKVNKDFTLDEIKQKPKRWQKPKPTDSPMIKSGLFERVKDTDSDDTDLEDNIEDNGDIIDITRFTN